MYAGTGGGKLLVSSILLLKSSSNKTVIRNAIKNWYNYIVRFGIYIGVCCMILPAKEQIEGLNHIVSQLLIETFRMLDITISISTLSGLSNISTSVGFLQAISSL